MLSQPALLPIDALRTLLGVENVIVDPDELNFYSTDVYRRADVDAAVVIRPGTVAELAEAVRLCTAADMAVIARGGGLSYTGGFLPVRGGTAIIDMLRLNQIVEINPVDMYVTVECGASWRHSHRRKVRLSWTKDGPGRRLLRPVSCADQPGVSRARRSASFSVCANDARSSGARKVPIFRPFPWLQTINWLQ